MGLRVKICGITRPEQGRAIAELGANTLGFICVPATPRYITPEQIAAVVAELSVCPATGQPISDRVGVFVNASAEVICQTVAIGNLNGVQLHGDESPEVCDRLRHALPNIEIIRALRIKSPEALAQVEQYQDWVDALLLDAYHPTLAGGTGKTLDWSTLQHFQPDRPWFLSGGLTPNNILDALAQLCPDGIDLSSGVERAPGDKDLEKVAQLFEKLGRRVGRF
ncbi:MAG: phosphoribosylanthranilate isomerase [Leptolyngbyaceae cyanobacterium RU_5_1]|nr:phosphoribosylanthranilate isomerase [Leptolyngbyaceae cyanobacterium RU_5_1]